MPKNTKSNSNSNSNKSSRNSSLKSTVSRTSETSVPMSMPISVDDDGFGGLLPKLKVVQNVNKQRETPSPPPPPSPKTPKQEPWEEFDMTEGEFNAMLQRVEERKKLYSKECYEQYLLAEWDSSSFWYNRIESLEKQREVFNTKRAWSAFDIEVVEQIDRDIKECEDNLERISDTMDRLENQYD